MTLTKGYQKRSQPCGRPAVSYFSIPRSTPLYATDTGSQIDRLPVLPVQSNLNRRTLCWGLLVRELSKAYLESGDVAFFMRCLWIFYNSVRVSI